MNDSFIEFTKYVILFLGHIGLYSFACYFCFLYMVVLLAGDIKNEDYEDQLIKLAKKYPIIEKIRIWYRNFTVILGNISIFIWIYYKHELDNLFCELNERIMFVH